VKYLKNTWRESRKIFSAWSDSEANTFGAAVAYYTVFSIAPLLVIVIGLVGLFINSQTAEARILIQFTNTFGEGGAAFVEAMVAATASSGQTIVISLIGFLVLLFGASGVFSQLQKGLNSIFEILPIKGSSGIWTTIRQKVLAVGMVFALGFLLLSSIAFHSIINFFAPLLAQYAPGGDTLLSYGELLLSMLLISTFLAIVYRVLPNQRLPWRAALWGGLIASVLFTISKFFLGWYLSSGSAFNAFGAASTLAVIIFWTYYMAQIFFLSAIIVKIYIVKKDD